MLNKLKLFFSLIFAINFVFNIHSQSIQKSSYNFTYKPTLQNNVLVTSGQVVQETNQTNIKLGYLPLNTSFLFNKFYFKKNTLIFPNPFSDVITLQLPEHSDVKQISIYSINGSIVFQKNSQISQSSKIQLQSLTSGLYFIKIKFVDNSIQTEKLIKL